MMVCVFLMMVLIATSCKARYVNADSEEAEALDKRRAMFDAFFKRGFEKRQNCLANGVYCNPSNNQCCSGYCGDRVRRDRRRVFTPVYVVPTIITHRGVYYCSNGK